MRLSSKNKQTHSASSKPWAEALRTQLNKLADRVTQNELTNAVQSQPWDEHVGQNFANQLKHSLKTKQKPSVQSTPWTEHTSSKTWRSNWNIHSKRMNASKTKQTLNFQPDHQTGVLSIQQAPHLSFAHSGWCILITVINSTSNLITRMEFWASKEHQSGVLNTQGAASL